LVIGWPRLVGVLCGVVPGDKIIQLRIQGITLVTLEIRKKPSLPFII
jgi:hypothetical protein